MNKINKFLISVLLFETALLFFQTSSSLFTDAALSTSNNFMASLEFSGPTGATGESGTTGPTGAINNLVVNEVYYDVDADHVLDKESSSEWVEIYNPTTSSVNLTGWTIEDNNGSDSLTGSILSESFLILISTDSASFLSKWSVPMGTNIQTVTGAIGGSFGLANIGDRLTLKNNSTEVDKMSWGNDTTGFLTGCTTLCPDVIDGHSLERSPDGFDTDSATDFVDRDPPTPGT